MNIFNYLILAVLFLSFIEKEKSAYDKERDVIINRRSLFQSQIQKANNSDSIKKTILAGAGKSIEESIVNKLIPHWYGTEWDFNGYTAVPGRGKIACGYFVSTVMLHAGFNLNRFKMAQKHSFEELKLYGCGGSMYDYRNTTKQEFISNVKRNLRKGLYIIALENHIGFLLYDDDVYFIHSNYRSPSVVIKENAENSAALDDTNRFMLTSISYNKMLLTKWIKNEKVGE